MKRAKIPVSWWIGLLEKNARCGDNKGPPVIKTHTVHSWMGYSCAIKHCDEAIRKTFCLTKQMRLRSSKWSNVTQVRKNKTWWTRFFCFIWILNKLKSSRKKLLDKRTWHIRLTMNNSKHTEWNKTEERCRSSSQNPTGPTETQWDQLGIWSRRARSPYLEWLKNSAAFVYSG